MHTKPWVRARASDDYWKNLRLGNLPTFLPLNKAPHERYLSTFFASCSAPSIHFATYRVAKTTGSYHYRF